MDDRSMLDLLQGLIGADRCTATIVESEPEPSLRAD